MEIKDLRDMLFNLRYPEPVPGKPQVTLTVYDIFDLIEGIIDCVEEVEKK